MKLGTSNGLIHVKVSILPEPPADQHVRYCIRTHTIALIELRICVVWKRIFIVVGLLRRNRDLGCHHCAANLRSFLAGHHVFPFHRANMRTVCRVWIVDLGARLHEFDICQILVRSYLSAIFESPDIETKVLVDWRGENDQLRSKFGSMLEVVTFEQDRDSGQHVPHECSVPSRWNSLVLVSHESWFIIQTHVKTLR